MSGKKLPMSISLSETYQGMSFMMGIIVNNPHISNEIYNAYVSLFCENKEHLQEIEMKFEDSLWEDFRLKGTVEMDLYYTRNMSKRYCCDFWRERLDQDNYILIFDIDEYYMPYSIHYKKEHYLHDVYIYGYEEDEFLIMAYRNQKLELFTVQQSYLKDSVYRSKIKSRDCHFCTVRAFHKAKVEIDEGVIKDRMKQYLNGQMDQENIAHGMQVYNVILNAMMKLDSEENLDIRVFRLLWEHKKMFLYRFEYLSEHHEFDSDVTKWVQNLPLEAYKVFMLSVKYNQIKKKSILEQMKLLLTEIRASEQEYIPRVLEAM